MPGEWRGYCRGGGCVVITQTIYLSHVEAMEKTKLIPELVMERDMYRLQRDDLRSSEDKLVTYSDGLATRLHVAEARLLMPPPVNWVRLAYVAIVGVLIGVSFGVGVAL